MDWLVTLFERDRMITFRALTRQAHAGAPLCDRERWIERGQEWGGRSFDGWLAFLKPRGGSVTIGFDGSDWIAR